MFLYNIDDFVVLNMTLKYVMCIVNSVMLNKIMFGLKDLLIGSFGSLGRGHWGQGHWVSGSLRSVSLQ